ncbi:MAG TPA: hypothetical protein VE646_12680, partial [Actinomycetota bacterium]|nr:hypothetical protein [Actinomycetota bacterium]
MGRPHLVADGQLDRGPLVGRLPEGGPLPSDGAAVAVPEGHAEAQREPHAGRAGGLVPLGHGADDQGGEGLPAGEAQAARGLLHRRRAGSQVRALAQSQGHQ